MSHPPMTDGPQGSFLDRLRAAHEMAAHEGGGLSFTGGDDGDVDLILAGAEAAMRSKVWLHVDADGACVFTLARGPEWVPATPESVAAAIAEATTRKVAR